MDVLKRIEMCSRGNEFGLSTWNQVIEVRCVCQLLIQSLILFVVLFLSSTSTFRGTNFTRQGVDVLKARFQIVNLSLQNKLRKSKLMRNPFVQHCDLNHRKLTEHFEHKWVTCFFNCLFSAPSFRTCFANSLFSSPRLLTFAFRSTI